MDLTSPVTAVALLELNSVSVTPVLLYRFNFPVNAPPTNKFPKESTASALPVALKVRAPSAVAKELVVSRTPFG